MVFLSGLKTMRGLSCAPFGSVAWWGWCGCSVRVAGLLFRLDGIPGGPVGTVKSFGEPHSVYSDE